jgi:hypothetical protein
MNAYFLLSLHLDGSRSTTCHRITTGTFVFISFVSHLCLQPRKLVAICRVSAYHTRPLDVRQHPNVANIHCSHLTVQTRPSNNQIILCSLWHRQVWWRGGHAFRLQLPLILTVNMGPLDATSASDEQAERTSCNKREMEVGRQCRCWCRFRSVDF